MTMTIEFYVAWTDERKAWSSGSATLIETWVAPSEVWYPTFYLADCKSELCVVLPDATNNLKITKDGLVSFRILRQYEVICDNVLDDFPFDYQICHLHFVIQDSFAYLYTLKMENITYFIQKSTTDDIVLGNGEWRLKVIYRKEELMNIAHRKFSSTPLQGSDIDITKEKGFSVILFFERYYWNYVYVIVIPSVVFSLLPVFVTCVPKESGEKLNFATVVLLTFIFFEALILSVLPNATTLPWIMVFVFIGSVFSIVYVLYGILVVFGYEMDILFTSQKLFSKLMTFLLCCDRRICCSGTPKSSLTQNQVKTTKWRYHDCQ